MQIKAVFTCFYYYFQKGTN